MTEILDNPDAVAVMLIIGMALAVTLIVVVLSAINRAVDTLVDHNERLAWHQQKAKETNERRESRI